MEVLLFEPETFNRLYNCSFYSTDIIPVENRRQRALGAFIFPSGALSFLLYVACVYAMIQRDTRARASYKLMILLAFFHLYGIVLSGMTTAYFYYWGTVYCELPTLIYVMGGYGTATWIGGTVAGSLLSFNRCCEMYSSALADALFGGKKVFVWMLLPLSLWLYCFLFTKPLLFNGIAMSWYFNPHYKYFDDLDGTYVNDLHTLNNTLTLMTQLMLSFTFVVLYFSRIKGRATKMSKNDKLMCLQVFIIGLFEITAGVTFLLQQRFQLSFALTMLAGVCYFGSQACAPYVYLTFNRTIRNIVLDKFCPCYKRRAQISTTLSQAKQSNGSSAFSGKG
ncbi:unnamed protein product [Bursaphelenchus xylophilus]|uniref:(pine wood nematode) hypothetical protein n=1 Tax=Bursaphelenchus xylophilus TaxID=6326 RepID=A0A1I7S6C8_BURXY|nr:unnamed protein product [Bursaphelenchus xylophilus]CAG9128131.1 unnamed protein product [Bursaphelenchus xylophilus]